MWGRHLEINNLAKEEKQKEDTWAFKELGILEVEVVCFIYSTC